MSFRFSSPGRRLVAVAAAVAAVAAAAPASAGAVYAFSLTPHDIHRAYGLPQHGPAHDTIAVVSAYHDPGAQADLTEYSSRFHLPSCTAAQGCFRQVNEDGRATPVAPSDASGGQFLTESSASLQTAHAVCPSCKLVLVEAYSTIKRGLATAVHTAATLGAKEIVVTFNQVASPDDSQYASDYAPRGAIVVAASGDTGYSPVADFPASLPNVLAVGGTALDLTSGGAYRGETAWNGSGTGCGYVRAGAWQTPFSAGLGCRSARTEVDLSAAALPGPIVHVQDLHQPGGPWYEVDGTSAAAPIIAGTIALAGGAGQAEPQRLYGHWRQNPSDFRDITSGTVSNCLGNSPLCSARQGYDGPTGMGTPNGLAPFLAGGGAVSARHPNLTLASGGRPWRVDRGGAVRLRLANQNPFAVHGRIALKRGGLALGSGSFSLGPLANTTVTMHLGVAGRRALHRGARASVTAGVQLTGSAGRAIRFSRRIATLYAS